MEGLISLLIFAGLFFFMMRFGCGAHARHGKSHTSNPDYHSLELHDPVCGMQVNSDEGYGFAYKSNMYRFCSRECLDKFDKNPEQYLTHQNHYEGDAR